VGHKTIDMLVDDWSRVAGSKKSQISFEKFVDLMQHLPPSDLQCLFELYDVDHNNKVSFDEYVLTVVILMDGTLNEKLSCTQLCGLFLGHSRQYLMTQFGSGLQLFL